jgi:DNA modification methylase
MDENSIDSIVTDPPYELGFMGKAWDRSGVANSVELWREALRVLKPGGHLLAFGGSRTYHRMACAIEDAGFEVRDQIMWLYGSGFPKSLDVSKAIDKRRATNDVIRPWLHSLGSREVIAKAAQVTPRQVDHWLGENKTPCPQTLTEDRFVLLCKAFGGVPEWAEDMFACVGEKLGTVIHGRSGGDDFAKIPGSTASSRTVEEFAPATDAAKQWSGYGTALKPAHEPVCVARKPLEGTVAANVQKHGTGALNIDGCRIEAGDDSVVDDGRRVDMARETIAEGYDRPNATMFRTGKPAIRGGPSDPLGRWPANVIHDGSEEVLDCFPITKNGGGNAGSPDVEGMFGTRKPPMGGTKFAGDSGSAARFFYCAKTSKAERELGCEDLTLVPLAYSCQAQAEVKRGNTEHAGNSGINTVKMRGNNHPTVKPLALMRYLCRLVTPPGGVVLDPFTGSGSTGVAAFKEGFSFIGIELNPEYVVIANARLLAEVLS